MSKAKIVGFSTKTTTRMKLMNNPIFQKACKRAAEDLEIPLQNILTKRQAAKFFRNTGLVFSHTKNE